jgi:hypothetical protein
MELLNSPEGSSPLPEWLALVVPASGAFQILKFDLPDGVLFCYI